MYYYYYHDFDFDLDFDYYLLFIIIIIIIIILLLAMNYYYGYTFGFGAIPPVRNERLRLISPPMQQALFIMQTAFFPWPKQLTYIQKTYVYTLTQTHTHIHSTGDSLPRLPFQDFHSLPV